MVPMAPSWVISKNRSVVARMVPDHAGKRFEIQVLSGVSAAELRAAEQGTVREGDLVYELDGKTYRIPIKTLRGDYRDADGNLTNNLRRWQKQEFKPRPEDIFQERLYCIHWVLRDLLQQSRKESFFASVTEDDFERERKVEAIVSSSISQWQEHGLVPDMAIEIGGPPRYQGRELLVARGWLYWHHLFPARHLLVLSLVHAHQSTPGQFLDFG